MRSEPVKRVRFLQFLQYGIPLLFILLAGCKLPPGLADLAAGLLTPTSTAGVVPAASKTPVPATATLPPTLRLAISPADITGTWTNGEKYVRFEADGRMTQADALDRLDSSPYATSRYAFSGTTITITEESARGVPSCGITAGRYEMRMQGSAGIRVAALNDPCGRRAAELDGHFVFVRTSTLPSSQQTGTLEPTPGGSP